MHTDDILTHRLDEREQEYQARLEALDWAAANPEPDKKLPKVVRALPSLLRQVDLPTVKRAVDQVHSDGYAIVENLLTAAEVSQLREQLAPLYAASARLYGRVGKQTVHVQNVLAKTDAADAVAALPLLRAVVAGVLSTDFILNAGAVAMNPDPGCDPQGLHRDDGFFSLIARPHLPLVVTVAVALDDFTAANGGTQLVPGSNAWAAEREAHTQEIIHAEMPAGAMLIWDGAVLHGGGGNRSEQPRRTLTLNYTRGWLRTQFNQYLSVPRARVLSMPPELQSDLGYHHSATGLGGCEFHDPLKYLQTLSERGGDGAQGEMGREVASAPRRATHERDR